MIVLIVMVRMTAQDRSGLEIQICTDVALIMVSSFFCLVVCFLYF